MPSELHPLIADRWSPRSFDGAHVIDEDALSTLIEAARWAPSYGNTQPTRLIVGTRGSDTFAAILGCLNSGNQRWANRASLLLVGVALTSNDKGEVPYAEYGVGAAMTQLVLQAHALGLAGHHMAGFSADSLHAEFTLPAGHDPLVVLAVGAIAAPELLADDLAEREVRPRRRIAVEEFLLQRGRDSH